jgi:hypothetical protein
LIESIIHPQSSSASDGPDSHGATVLLVMLLIETPGTLVCSNSHAAKHRGWKRVVSTRGANLSGQIDGPCLIGAVIPSDIGSIGAAPRNSPGGHRQTWPVSEIDMDAIVAAPRR